ncbi:MAG: chromate transporter [Paenibacillaceae bacterium]|nr:chromate transporter [Paenibacillaceae bacterium]
MALWQLFWTFFKIGCFSFGGGYAITPVIEKDAVAYGWLTPAEFTDAVAVAGMAPGPIATNSAVFVGYKTAGLAGALSATAGIVLPSLIIVIILAAFFYKIHRHPHVQAVFYGLRPVVSGLIVYAAIRFGMNGGYLGTFAWQGLVALLILIGALLALIRFRLHPVVVLLMSGLAGIVIYS